MKKLFQEKYNKIKTIIKDINKDSKGNKKTDSNNNSRKDSGNEEKKEIPEGLNENKNQLFEEEDHDMSNSNAGNKANKNLNLTNPYLTKTKEIVSPLINFSLDNPPKKGVKLFIKNIYDIIDQAYNLNPNVNNSRSQLSSEAFEIIENDNIYYNQNHEIIEVFNKSSLSTPKQKDNLETEMKEATIDNENNTTEEKDCIKDNKIKCNDIKTDDNEYHVKKFSPEEFSINPIFLVAAIGFHHTKGSIVEYSYPETKEIIYLNKNLLNFICFNDPNVKSFESILDNILNRLTFLCLPDAVHLTNNDTQFFIIQNYSKLFFGVSCYRQIKTSSKTVDCDNTRECVQKAICIISTIPLFGNLYSKLNMTVSAYFNQETLMDKEILHDLYNNYQNISFKNINLNELNMSFSLKKLLLFCKTKVS